jgi:hypothetical protein
MLFKKYTAILFILWLSVFTAKAATTDTVKHDLNIVFIGNSITHGAGLKDWKTEAPPNETVNYLKQQPGIGMVDFANQDIAAIPLLIFYR